MVTVVVSTLLENDAKVSSQVCVFRGIVIDTDSQTLFRLEVKNSPGWLTTTRWMTSSEIVSKLNDRWNAVTTRLDECQRKVHKGLQQKQFGAICLSALKNGILDISVPGRRDIESSRGSKQCHSIAMKLRDVMIVYDAERSYVFSLSTMQKEYMGN